MIAEVEERIEELNGIGRELTTDEIIRLGQELINAEEKVRMEEEKRDVLSEVELMTLSGIFREILRK